MKKSVLFVALCCAAGSLFAQVDPAQLMKEGNEALNAKNYEVAFTKYDAYLKQTNFADSVTAYNCGVCADKTDRHADAERYFDVAIQKNYNLANAYIGKAGALKSQNKMKEYEATLAEGLKAVPGNATLEKLSAILFLKDGQVFQKKGDVEQAEICYKKATELSGKTWKVNGFYSLGVLFYNSGATVLQKAVPLASDAEKYAVEKDKAVAYFKKAESYLQEAIKLDPQKEAYQTLLKQVQDQLK